MPDREWWNGLVILLAHVTQPRKPPTAYSGRATSTMSITPSTSALRSTSRTSAASNTSCHWTAARGPGGRRGSPGPSKTSSAWSPCLSVSVAPSNMVARRTQADDECWVNREPHPRDLTGLRRVLSLSKYLHRPGSAAGRRSSCASRGWVSAPAPDSTLCRRVPLTTAGVGRSVAAVDYGHASAYGGHTRPGLAIRI